MRTKHFIIIALLLASSLCVIIYTGYTAGENLAINRANTYVARYFPQDRVIDIHIDIDPADWQSMLDNPLAEEYHVATVVIDGVRKRNVAIRTKGNSSLNTVARSDSERYSFKIEFDHYVKGESLSGLTKLNLNNNWSDASYMREYLSYKIFAELGVPTPACVYANISINGTPWGLYLAVEDINESFLARNFKISTGDLYKPDGVGSDLQWLGADISAYTGVELKTNKNTSDGHKLIAMLDALNNGGDLEQYLDVDNVLRYLAVSTALVNLDSYQGQFKHNYYLYEQNGKFMVLPWDLNMSMGGFNMGQNSAQSADFPIDEPTQTAMSERPLIAKLLEIPEYMDRYHSYMQQLIDGPLATEVYNTEIDRLYALISAHVKNDPTKFYTYEQFEAALSTTGQGTSSIRSFMSARVASIAGQLAGEIASTGNGQWASGRGGMQGNIGQIPQGGQQGFPQGAQQQGFPQIGGMPPEGQRQQPPQGQQQLPPQGQQRPQGQVQAGQQIPGQQQQRPQGQIQPGQQLPQGGMFPGEDGRPGRGTNAQATATNTKVALPLLGGSVAILLLGTIATFRVRRRRF